MGLRERLNAKGPKRILSLDGGGARILLTVGFLESVENELRQRYGEPDFRLCDYFDLIGGTSAGSLVASALATGMRMCDVVDYSINLVERIFGRRKWQPWEALYDEGPLEEILVERFGEMTLGSPDIETGLCVVTKRADTRSTWPFHNHPDGQFFSANKDIPLRDIVRASTAAPFYFVPAGINVGGSEQGAFFDGAVSLANNPAMQLFTMATLSGFPFHWRTGADQILLTSIGAGSWQQESSASDVLQGKAWDWAWEVPTMLIEDASTHNQMMLQWMSRSPTNQMIDLETGDLGEDLLGAEPLLHYLRYDVRLEADALALLGFRKSTRHINELRSLSCAKFRHDLLDIGRAAAKQQVEAAHFPGAFDPG